MSQPNVPIYPTEEHGEKGHPHHRIEEMRKYQARQLFAKLPRIHTRHFLAITGPFTDALMESACPHSPDKYTCMRFTNGGAAGNDSVTSTWEFEFTFFVHYKDVRAGK